MTQATLIENNAIQEKLKDLPKWELKDNAIVRVQEFSDYLSALDFVYALGHESETNNHHPDISMKYKTVTVSFSTHSAGGITDLDLRMAKISETVIKEVTQETAK